MQRLLLDAHTISINEDESLSLKSDIALDVKTNTLKLNVDLKDKISENETSDRNTVLILLNDLFSLLRDLQATETMLENKISSSFFKYYNSFKLGPFCMHVLKALTLIDLAFIGIEEGATELPNRHEENMTFLILAGFIGGALLTASLIVGYRSYKSDIRSNCINEIIDLKFETVSPLSTIEASHIQNTLTTLKYYPYGYPGDISPTITGDDIRSCLSFLACARQYIEAQISYIHLRKNSLFKALPNIPNNIKAIVLEYDVNLEREPAHFYTEPK